MEQIKLSTAAIITLAAVSPLAHDFSKHLKLFIIVSVIYTFLRVPPTPYDMVGKIVANFSVFYVQFPYALL